MASPLDKVDGLDWDEDADDFEAFMREMYPKLFEAAYAEANDQLPVDVTFDVTDKNVQKVIDQLATRIRGVSDTTRDDIKGLVGRMLTEGRYDEGADRTVIPSNQEIASRIREAAPDFSKSRSVTIARTETGEAMNLAHTYAYEDAGVSKVEVMDGDDDEICASANGQTWTLDEARENPLGHPNCQRAFAPIVE